VKAQAILDTLEDAATRLGVRVSYESLLATVGHGGLCRVRGEYRVIIDRRATPEERVVTLAGALARLDLAPLAPADDPDGQRELRGLRDLIDQHVAVAPRRAN